MSVNEPREPQLTPEKWKAIGRNVSVGGTIFAVLVFVYLLATGTPIGQAAVSAGGLAVVSAVIGWVAWQQQERARWVLLAINGGLVLLMVVLSQMGGRGAS